MNAVSSVAASGARVNGATNHSASAPPSQSVPTRRPARFAARADHVDGARQLTAAKTPAARDGRGRATRRVRDRRRGQPAVHRIAGQDRDQRAEHERCVGRAAEQRDARQHLVQRAEHRRVPAEGVKHVSSAAR